MNKIHRGWAAHNVLQRLLAATAFLFCLVSPAAQAEPAYQWTLVSGGANTDSAESVAVDGQGNVYHAGSFRGTVDFDPGPGVDNKSSGGGDDIFITKTNADGSYAWAKTIGTSTTEIAHGIAVDLNGNIFVVGEYLSLTVDFDPGTGADSRSRAGSNTAFLTKLNTDGSYGWTRTFGGNQPTVAYGVATDAIGNVFVTGWFNGGVNFDREGAGDNRSPVGGYDVFLTKILANGAYGWTRTFGSIYFDSAYSVSADANGAAYVTGYIKGATDFNPGSVSDVHSSAGGADVFITKINGDGGYAWSRTFGGSGDEQGKGVTVDNSGEEVYLTGWFSGSVDFDPGSATDSRNSNGGADVFLTKLTTDGNYAWTRTLGGAGQDEGRAIARTNANGILIAGTFAGAVDFDPGASSDIQNTGSSASLGAFLTQFQSDGTYRWTRSVGGSGNPVANAVAAPATAAYLAGKFSGTVDFDPGTAGDTRSSAGSTDIFTFEIRHRPARHHRRHTARRLCDPSCSADHHRPFE